MMTKHTASRWPPLQKKTLANLQERGSAQFRLPKTVEVAGRWNHFVGSYPPTPPQTASDCYRIIPMTSCEIVSKVVTVFEFASKARWATIRSENSVEISTLDCSSAPSSTVPRPP